MPLEKTLKQIEEEFGEGALDYLGANHHGPVPVVPSGAFSLDRALGVGGYPKGKIIEIFGPESAGKSTLLYHAFTEAQKLGGTCALIDTEHSFDPTYGQALGMDTESLLISQPDYGEQGMEIVHQLVKSRDVAVIGVDSVAALAPRAEVEGQMGDSHVGLLARLMSQGLRMLTTTGLGDTVLIFTNQIREKVGVMSGFGPVETQPGGRAMKFYATQRLDIRRIETIRDSKKNATGIKCRVKVIKNKVAAPYKEALFDIDYGHGVSNEGCVLDAADAAGLLSKKGNHLSFGETKLGNGRAQAKAFLSENPEAMEELMTALSPERKPHDEH